MEQLEQADTSRHNLKKQLQESNNKIVDLEEELYGSKKVQSELL